MAVQVQTATVSPVLIGTGVTIVGIGVVYDDVTDRTTVCLQIRNSVGSGRAGSLRGTLEVTKQTGGSGAHVNLVTVANPFPLNVINATRNRSYWYRLRVVGTNHIFEIVAGPTSTLRTGDQNDLVSEDFDEDMLSQLTFYWTSSGA